MSGGHFSVGTFQIGTKLSDPILEIFVQTGLFWGEFFITELFKISILCGNGTSAGSLQVIQAFSDFPKSSFTVSEILLSQAFS